MPNNVVSMANPRTPVVALWLLLAAAALMVLPEEMQARCRLMLGDFMSPGCKAWRAAEDQVQTLVARWKPAASSSENVMQQVREELEAEQARCRQLEVQLARAHDELQSHRLPLFESPIESRAERLGQPALTQAAVLGPAHAALWRRGRWLAEGKAGGLLEEAPILADGQPLLDLGRDAGLSAEDRLLLGRCVIGKVAQVGRWTSTFYLVTDAEFRGRAQLVRETHDGFAFGAKGILKGQGTGVCRLEGISAEESVDVGDRVYTADRDGLLPTPLFYGEVIEATLPERGKEWHVLVRPAARPAELTTVQVLRSELNLKRVMAN